MVFLNRLSLESRPTGIELVRQLAISDSLHRDVSISECGDRCIVAGTWLPNEESPTHTSAENGTFFPLHHRTLFLKVNILRCATKTIDL